MVGTPRQDGRNAPTTSTESFRPDGRSKNTPSEHTRKNTSPEPPRGAASQPSSASAKEGEDSDRKKTDLVEAVHTIRPSWSRSSIREALDAALADGRPWPAIARAFPKVAADEATNFPGRLHANGPWWDDEPPPKPARPPWCGECDERTRQREFARGVGRCPTCHPLQIRKEAA
jgi:hypothetical protein